MENPIKDNRIVSSITFAVRLELFIRDVQVCDACSDEEKEYLLMVARELKKYQIATATDKDEVAYLKRLGLI